MYDTMDGVPWKYQQWSSHIKCSPSLILSNQMVMMSAVLKNEISITSFLDAFSLRVWVLMALSLLAVSVFTSIAQIIENQHRNVRGYVTSFVASLWMYFITIFGEDDCKAIKSKYTPQLYIYFLWIFFTIPLIGKLINFV